MFLLRKANYPYFWIIGSLFFIILLVVVLNKFDLFYINYPEDEKEALIFSLKFTAFISIVVISIWYTILRILICIKKKK